MKSLLVWLVTLILSLDFLAKAAPPEAFDYDVSDDSWASWRGGIEWNEDSSADGDVASSYQPRKKPNIIFMLLDDWGWNDVGYHNPEVRTPHIDNLAKDGLILEQHYAAAYCTPSRAALMTGMFPYHIGRQRWLFENSALGGLTLERKLLPEYLKDMNYSTNLIGKWHLGHCNKAYLPKSRGFDTQFGGFLAAHYPLCHVEIGKPFVYDFFDDEVPVANFSAVGNSQMDMFDERTVKLIHSHAEKQKQLAEGHENPLFLYLAYTSNHFPVSAPAEFLDLYPGVSDAEKRRSNMAMTSHMDAIIGNAVKALKDANLYDDSIIVLMGDNGAYTKWPWLNFYGGGSNEPLRGQKGLYYEGGTRVPALIHSPLLKRTGRSYDMVHIADWLPTLISAAGGNPADYPELQSIDGKDQYHTFLCDQESPRKAFVYNLQNEKIQLENETASHVIMGAVRYGRWKLLNFDESARPLNPPGTYELYDLEKDPNETTDIFALHPIVAKRMIEKFRQAASSLVPEQGLQQVPRDLLKVIHNSEGVLRTDFCTLDNEIREDLLVGLQ